MSAWFPRAKWSNFFTLGVVIAGLCYFAWRGGRRREPPSPRPATKWDLWAGATRLRGANLWQRRIEPERDGDSLGTGAVGPPYAQAELRALAGLGANYVNLSYPGIFTEKAPFVLDEAVEKNLELLVGQAREADLFAVVSFRTGPGRNEAGFDASERTRAVHAVWSDAAAQDAWVAMWRHAAQRLRGHPAVAAYHLMVEPNANAVLFGLDVPGAFQSRYGGSLADWNPLARRIVAAIRETDRDTPILVGGMGYSSVAWLDAIEVDGDRLVLNAHFYEPYEYTHQTDARLPLQYPAPGRDRDRILSLLAPIERVKKRTGRPVSVGEFGVMRWEPGAARYLEDVLDALESLGVNHAVWLWESAWPGISYDDFNFRRGPERSSREELATSPLGETLRRYWRKNTARPSGFAFHLN